MNPELIVYTLQEWHDGQYRGVDDAIVLAEAYKHGLTFVTRDLKTIPPLLHRWFEESIEHSGVILIDGHTIAEADIGGLARALLALTTTYGEVAWTDRCVYLEAVD